MGFEFGESVFCRVLVTDAVFFGLLNKSSILKCFICSTVFFVSSFIHQVLQESWVSVNHTMLDFCKMNTVFEGIFRVLLCGKYCFGFSVSGKIFFGSFGNTQLR